MNDNPDESFMRLAIGLARHGAGYVSPNPLVGCVIVRDGKIIAQGYHKKFGGDHAEIDALKKIKCQAKGATLYVNLEPCHHYGKTPPCVDAVIKSGVARVVIAMRDPNPLTSGKSVSKLKKAGIEVKVGVCEKEARELNRFFIKWISQNRPYVIVKVAQSLDGKITSQKGRQGWITGKAAKACVQDLRAQVDAVLIGRKTLEIDDPRLNVRKQTRPQPQRVILDSNLTTPLSRKIFSTPGGSVIYCCTLAKTHPKVLSLQKIGAKVVCLKPGRGQIPLQSALSKLASFGISSILVEGGAEVFASFLKSNLADEWLFILAPKIVGAQGLNAFPGDKKFRFSIRSLSPLGKDILIRAVKR